MARRRGFFAELNYQAQQAERRRRAQGAAAARAMVAAQREAERRQREADRLQAAAARASAADRAQWEREAAEAQVQSRVAEVGALNAELKDTYANIDGLLAATLDVDDHVDLESMKVTDVQHPRFDPGELGTAIPAIPPLEYPPEPTYQEPLVPTGLGSAFGGRKRHQVLVEHARAEYELARGQWQADATKIYAEHVAAMERRDKAEAERLRKLAAARAEYDQECRQREADVVAQNDSLTQLINNLAFDVGSAIDEYVDIVLSSSVYPDAFPVSYEHDFSIDSRELSLTALIPDPSGLPTAKEYRYVKAKDEVASTRLPIRAQKERYASAVWQVAVRTMHEIFEADRSGKIHSIALTVAVERANPATGLTERVPLVVAAADRATFSQFDLANVVPHATLAHLGAALSKSPYDLAQADTSRGVRARG